MTDKPDAGELLPCPFCGGPGQIAVFKNSDGSIRNVTARCNAMKPGHCSAVVYEQPDCGGPFTDRASAIAAWNRRSSSKRIEELEKALGEIACFDDKPANAHLATYGTFGGFDEPGSVEIARAALSPSNGGGEMAPASPSRSPATKPSDA